jgi:O-antigen/teichoic acid export membrane protein
MILIAIAYPFIYVLLTPKWLPSVPYFQLLCLASLFTPFYVLNMCALNARGKSKITFGIEIIKKSLIILSVLCCFRFGVTGLLWGYVLSCFLSYLISTYYIKKDIHLSINNQIRDLLPNMVVGSILAILAFSVSLFITKPLLLLLSQMILILILYFLYIRFTQPKLISQIFGIVRDKLEVFTKSIKNRNK